MQIEAIGDKQLDAAFARLTKASDSPFTEFELAEPLHKDFAEIEEDEFQSAGHGEWDQLAESTIESKGNGAFSFISILRETNDLYFSLARPGDVNAVLFQEGPKVLVMGSRVSYGGYHMKRYRNRPARPPIRRELRKVDRLKMEKTIRKQAAKFTKGLGFRQTEVGDFN